LKIATTFCLLPGPQTGVYVNNSCCKAAQGGGNCRAASTAVELRRR
jgi:hypothetical protein